MTKSYPWPGIVGGAGAGDDAGRYIAAEWWGLWATVRQGGGLIVPAAADPLRTTSDWTYRGVFYGVSNRLEVTDGGGFVVDVDLGAALVDGTFFYEDVGRSLTMPASQTYYVVVRKNYTAADYTPPGYAAGDGVVPAYTARITWVSALVQSTDRTTYWDIPLATVVTDGSSVTSIVNTAEYINFDHFVNADVSENDIVHDAVVIGAVVSNGDGEDDFGAAALFQLENDDGDVEDAGRLAIVWTDSTNGSEDSREELYLSSGNAMNLSRVTNAPATASVDGNARGAGATDLQQYRTAATQVASGQYAFVVGQRNTASNTSACALGNLNVASNTHSFACGVGNTASGDGSFAQNYNNTASGQFSHAQGAGNTSSGYGSHAAGATCVASGDLSHAEGSSCTADANYSWAIGRGADANTFDGVFIWGDSTATPVTADNANQFKVQANGGVYFIITSTSAALPVMTLDQADVDEPYIKVIGDAAAANLTRNLVDEGDQGSETREGWFKIEVLDDGNQITDGDYYVPFYSLSA